ncbi:hypothetical protein PACID_29290 [Acidipropionibacterium acidipropionici ATCC 4875]|uniref:Uncharacterized protein n=1 Tax=Acidipropionibacterium acidipropionici (strain ATCC 4875 / DSM 20272 / JCM 6432 / NBRC 12425 / NCIMB 8070 / 4) TaxID=1171373 RepID=K7RRL1_ACIA4|nr:hypothetical protein PACID_29290 [Acidipropionibacterium acidipropionici ATCC 4875]
MGPRRGRFREQSRRHDLGLDGAHVAPPTARVQGIRTAGSWQESAPWTPGCVACLRR